MPSPKRRSSSSSGKSAKSKTTDTSSRARSSSSNAPSSSDDGLRLHGRAYTVGEQMDEVARVGRLLDAARARLRALERTPYPTMALLRTAHQQRLRREQRHIRQLEEYLGSLAKVPE